MAKQKLIPALMLFSLLSPSLIYAALPFKTYTAEYQSLKKEVLLDAVIEAVKRSTVSAETSGRIMEVNFDIGDHVQAGSVLVRIASAEQQSQFAATEAQQSEAEARLQEAKTEYERIQGVYEKKLVAKSALDKAAADLKAAQQRYQAATARVKQAREQLRYTVVKAPYSGVVVDRFVELGELVAPGKPVMTGLSLKELRAAVQIPQSLMDQMETIKKVRLLFSQTNGDGQSKERSVESQRVQLSPQADPRTHTFMARAYLPEDIPGLYPGMYAKMAVVTGETKTLLVPEQAIVHRSELTAVYVVNDANVHLRQVRIGSREDGHVEIVAGLEVGEQVALDPIEAGIYLKTQSGENSNEPGNSTDPETKKD